MIKYNQPLYKILIRKFPDPAALPGELFPYFYDIVLNRDKERCQLLLLLARLKPQDYSELIAMQILQEYIGEQIPEQEIERLIMDSFPSMIDLIEHDKFVSGF